MQTFFHHEGPPALPWTLVSSSPQDELHGGCKGPTIKHKKFSACGSTRHPIRTDYQGTLDALASDERGSISIARVRGHHIGTPQSTAPGRRHAKPSDSEKHETRAL